MGPSAISGLPPHVETVLKDFLEAARKAFAERMVSIVLFGSGAENRLRPTSDVNLLVVLNEFNQKDISELSPAVRMARVVIRLEVMYVLANELPAAVECFAQKFGDIIRRHRILAGVDPFDGLAPTRHAEIYRLRQVIFNLQLRMRQGFAERAGQEDMLAQLIADISGPLRTCAAALARLENQGNYSPKEALEKLVNSFGRADASRAVFELSELRERRTPQGDLPTTFFLLLEIVERIRSRAWRLE
jgi:predicted nucleotidyltransferase